jgi:hypothetical protein
MSQPSIPGSGSGLGAGFFNVAIEACAFFVLISLSGGRLRAINKKPTTVASRGWLSRFDSSATSPGGVAVGYDDRDSNYQDRQRIH